MRTALTRSLFTLVLALAVLAAPVASPTSTANAASHRAVSPDGDDSASGTAQDPWRTLEKAFESLRAGDTLTVHGGTYRERLTGPKLASGTKSAPIQVRAAAGERPVVQGLLWLRSADWWVFDGINVTWDASTGSANEHMVKMTDGVGWRFQNAEIWGARSYAGMLVASSGSGEPSEWHVTSNCIHDTVPSNSTNQDHLIYVNTGTNGGGGRIEGNLLYDAPNGEGVKLGGADSSSGTSNVVISSNTISGTAQPILVAWKSADNVIDGNLLIGAEANYGSIRSYELTNSTNTATNNAAGGSNSLLMDYNSPDGRITDGGGNSFPVDAGFDATSGCGGFQPKAAMSAYGHTAFDSASTTPPAGSDAVGDDTTTCEPGDDQYCDVPRSNAHHAGIMRLSAEGIVRGFASGHFGPDLDVSRGQTASMIAEGFELEDRDARDQFLDVPGTIHEEAIASLASAGIARGDGDGNFDPHESVSRGQAATLLASAMRLEPASSTAFPDAKGTTHEDAVWALDEAGITSGFADGTFRPADPISRGQLASWLAEALDL